MKLVSINLIHSEMWKVPEHKQTPYKHKTEEEL